MLHDLFSILNSSIEGNILTDDQGNILTDDQGNILTDDQGNILTDDQGNILTDDQGNILTDDQGNILTDDQGNILTDDQGNILTDDQGNISTESDHIGQVISGNPEVDSQYWSWQGTDNSCAVVAQKEVLESLGYDIPQTELKHMAYENGWYDKTGTPIEDIGNILEAYHIPVEKGHDKSIIDIYNALENGEKVIVGLDANKIWYPAENNSGNPAEHVAAGHAVWVTGIDMDKEGKLSVIMNDSGKPDGVRESVNIEDFKNAWQDYGNFAVITRIHTGRYARNS